MKIAVGSDHAGYEAKDLLVAKLREAGHEVVDCGGSADRIDYPEPAAAVGRAVADGGCARGILVCGTGIGVAMAANKIPGIRAAVTHDHFTTRMSREHNNANVLCLGARVLDTSVLLELAEEWLAIDFAGGRHEARVKKIDALDHAQT